MAPDRVMLTTLDNPYNPFTHFKEWYVYDTQLGYHTSALLSRVVITSEETSEADQELDYERAIEEIIQENVSGMHKKVYAPEDGSYSEGM